VGNEHAQVLHRLALQEEASHLMVFDQVGTEDDGCVAVLQDGDVGFEGADFACQFHAGSGGLIVTDQRDLTSFEVVREEFVESVEGFNRLAGRNMRADFAAVVSFELRRNRCQRFIPAYGQKLTIAAYHWGSDPFVLFGKGFVATVVAEQAIVETCFHVAVNAHDTVITGLHNAFTAEAAVHAD